MKSSECDILIVPGWTNSGPDHWQSRWERSLSRARRVKQVDWDKPTLSQWMDRIVEETAASDLPVVLVAHALGVHAVVHASERLAEAGAKGAYLVAPTSADAIREIGMIDPAFAEVPRDPLAFPAVVIASRNDDYCSFETAEDYAFAWGAVVADAGNAGHINSASGFGPWPEGSLRFARFLAQL